MWTSQQLTSLLLVAAMLAVTPLLAAPPHSTTTSWPFLIDPRVQFNKDCRCGLRGGMRIVGGKETGVNEWPWQVALMSGASQFCGGSLINDRYVLTAAHCVQNLLPSDVSVRLGEHQLSTVGEAEVLVSQVSGIIVHQQYSEQTLVNDIALLKLTNTLQVSDTMLPVCLPPPNPGYTGKKAVVTGWGTTSSGGLASDVLKQVTVKVLSNKACGSTNYGSSIVDTMLCAGKEGKDACQGDSGGPLVFKDNGGRYDQIGIVSWGTGCGWDGYPGVYTRVNKYLNWIKANTADGVYCKGMKL